MNRRVIPLLRRPVSEIGLGCWQLGGDWGEVDDATAMRILQTAVDNDVDFFDTADIYGDGRSEALIGRFLKTVERRPFVATKIGQGGGDDRYALPVMRAHVEGSLRRLGVGTLDLVQLHCVPRRELEKGDVFRHLGALRDEGKLRAFGASVETIDEAMICLEQPGLASLQIIFNLFRQDPADELLERAKARRVAIIVRLPLASGALGGKLHLDSQFAPDDHRSFNRDGEAFHVGETFSGLPFEKAIELADEVQELVPTGYTPAELAQRWILDHPAVTTVITGASRPEQVYENAGVSELPPLDAQIHQGLREFYDEAVRPHIRGAI